jgi:hypothetical protein
MMMNSGGSTNNHDSAKTTRDANKRRSGIIVTVLCYVLRWEGMGQYRPKQTPLPSLSSSSSAQRTAIEAVMKIKTDLPN